MANSSGPGFFTGFILGGFIGAAVVFLLTPRPGEEMRQELKERADGMAARARIRADEFLTMGREAFEEGRESLRQTIVEGREAATRARADLQSKFEESRRKQPEQSKE